MLERVLDRGVVIVGDIRVNLLDIELLTVKLRLLIASVDTARELGIDWWEHDPWLSRPDHDLAEENRRLRRRLAEAENDSEYRDYPRDLREGRERREEFEEHRSRQELGGEQEERRPLQARGRSGGGRPREAGK
ncbi:gas vesicle protein [Streptosporangium sp. NPDC048047]|uniref:gas vesicle protein n=1 Tax=Streptosporangium sp. NPDC048047 TaxID=3155748 RepID=UPI00343ED26B